MLRTSIGIVVLIASILWTPVWVQIGLFVVAVIVLRYRLVLLIPAMIADALYAPRATPSLAHNKMTLMVGVMLLVWFIIVTQTRLGNGYGIKTK